MSLLGHKSFRLFACNVSLGLMGRGGEGDLTSDWSIIGLDILNVERDPIWSVKNFRFLFVFRFFSREIAAMTDIFADKCLAW